MLTCFTGDSLTPTQESIDQQIMLLLYQLLLITNVYMKYSILKNSNTQTDNCFFIKKQGKIVYLSTISTLKDIFQTFAKIKTKINNQNWNFHSLSSSFGWGKTLLYIRSTRKKIWIFNDILYRIIVAYLDSGCKMHAN